MVGPCSVISPRKTSFQGLFDQLTNVTHILSASSCSKGSLIFHDSFYACCSASLESQSASSALFNFHLGISLLLENFCPLEVPFSESSMNIFPISRDEIVLFFLSSRPLNETSILFSNSSNNIDLYSSSSDVLLDQYSLLVEVLHPKYLFQCTRNCFQVLDLYSLKRIPQTLTKFSNIHQCCKVLSDQEADHVSYFLLASDESLILYGLFGDRVRELFRKNIQDHVLSLSAILKSHHLLIAYTTINQGSTMCLVLNLPKDLSKGNWTEYRSFQLDFSVTDVMFLAQYLCIINHPLTKIAYLVTSCMDGRIVIFRVNFDSLELGAEWLLNAHAHSSVRDILRGPMLTHCNETDKTPSFIINTVHGPIFYSSDSQGRWKSETIYAPSQATHALSLVLISNSNIVPNSVDSLKLFPPTRLIWLDRDEERKLSLCIGQILPPSRKQIIPDLIQDIEGAVLEVIFLPFIVPMALISWTKSPLHGNADVGVNLYGLSAFQLHWTATFKFIDAISQCPIPPQSTNHLIGCFLIMNNHSNIDCYGVSSSSSENQYSVSHLLSSVVVHHPHLSPQLLANDSFLYLSESALIVYQWTNDITFLDSNYCLLPRTSTLMLVSNHSFNKQQVPDLL